MNFVDQPLTALPGAVHPCVLPRSAWWNDDQMLELLAIKVISRAVREAMQKKGQPEHCDSHPTRITLEARAWLTSAEAECFIEIAGLDLDEVRAWVETGCLLPSDNPQTHCNKDDHQKRDL